MSLGLTVLGLFRSRGRYQIDYASFIHFRYQLKIVDIVLLISIYETKSNLMSKFGIISVAFLDAVQFVFLNGFVNVYAGNQLALLLMSCVSLHPPAQSRIASKRSNSRMFLVELILIACSNTPLKMPA
jgi:hypothetical protein